MNMTLRWLPEAYSFVQLPADAPVPNWVFDAAWYSVSKTQDEVSITVPTSAIPDTFAGTRDDGWCGLYVDESMDLNITGIAAALTQPLAEAQINLTLIATYNTDYVFVPQAKKDAAQKALSTWLWA